MTPARGTLLLVDLEPTAGQEKRGTRPCILVSDPVVNASQRFPLLAVVPITKPSFPRVEQLRSIDKRRIRRRYGLRKTCGRTRGGELGLSGKPAGPGSGGSLGWGPAER